MTQLVPNAPRLDGLAYVTSDEFQKNADTETARWDKEWMRYFSLGKEYWFYFYDMSSSHYALTVGPAKIATFSCEEMFSTKFYKQIVGAVWANGSDLVNKDILEIGCGPGVFGRVSGRFATSYTGIDVSRFALYIARLTSPATCRYFHLYDRTQLAELAKSFDTCLGRHFFIHHNYEDSLWILRLLRDLTRDGGLILADFFCDSASLDGNRRVTALDSLREEHPSALFSFWDEDVQRLASDAGLHCERIEHRAELQRRFVRFRVPAQAA
jgi:SAM-dependent methyltransferase